MYVGNLNSTESNLKELFYAYRMLKYFQGLKFLTTSKSYLVSDSKILG